MATRSEQIVEDLFRTEYGKLVSGLTRFFGSGNIQLAEDIIQETLIAALDHWSTTQIPDNPTGWLVQVAKRKALNELKRNKMMQRHHASGVLGKNPEYELEQVFLENEIEDSQLRMIFTCCHPSLSTESQIALTLKTLCGFGVKEVANALLATEPTINKRLYRAKKNIREADVSFNIPQGRELSERLDVVGLTLYLMFNEGYNSTASSVAITKELCLEAIRLTKLLVAQFEEYPKLSALLSLMCFHVARFDARIDTQGAIVLFEDQDPSLWNQELIATGIHYLRQSMNAEELSVYHIEARIAAEHCLADGFETTNWESIYEQYELLSRLKPNPIIELNQAIIQSKLSGLEESLSLLKRLEEKGTLKNYHLLPATQGVFYMKMKNYTSAISYLNKALELNPSTSETRFIEQRISECKEGLGYD